MLGAPKFIILVQPYLQRQHPLKVKGPEIKNAFFEEILEIFYIKQQIYYMLITIIIGLGGKWGEGMISVMLDILHHPLLLYSTLFTILDTRGIASLSTALPSHV